MVSLPEGKPPQAGSPACTIGAADREGAAREESPLPSHAQRSPGETSPLRPLALGLLLAASLACSGGGGGGGGNGASGPDAIELVEAAAIARSVLQPPTRLTASDAASFASAVTQANALGCGVEIAVSGSFVSNAVLTAVCPSRDELGIRVIGPASIEGELVADCTGPGCAWVSFEGLEVTNADGDAFDCDGSARMAVLDSTGDVTGPFNNVLTSHGSCEMLALGVSGSSGGSERGPTIAVIDGSKATIVGTGEFVASDTPFDAAVLLGGSAVGTRLAILGHLLTCRASGQYALDFEPLAGGSSAVTSGRLSANCPADLRLSAGETASWSSFFDAVSYLGSPPDVELVVDDTSASRLVELPVAIPEWVDGRRWTHVRVTP